MPMGIVSDEEFETELRDSSRPVVMPEILPMPNLHGRSAGDVNVPNFLRELIGSTSEIDGRAEALQLADQFGISPSSVSAYANGSTSTASMHKQPNLDKINRAKHVIGVAARNKIRRALANITEPKLATAKPAELATIARQLAGVVKDMEPEGPKGGEGGKDKPQFVVFAPQFREENHYATVVARE